MKGQEVDISGYEKSIYDIRFNSSTFIESDNEALLSIHEDSLSLAVLTSISSPIFKLVKERMIHDGLIILASDINISEFEKHIKDLIEKRYDDLDYIFFGCFKKDLFTLYIYLQNKGYKICMPIKNEQKIIELLSEPNITLQCENRYNAQQKLNL